MAVKFDDWYNEDDHDLFNFPEEAIKAAWVAATQEALREIVEIYAGMEGFKPETAPEAYQRRIIEQMYEVARECLKNQSP